MRSLVPWLWRFVVAGMLTLMGLGIYSLVGCPSAGAKMQRVDADMHAISSSLKTYKLNAGHYPSTEQGLEALVERPEGPPHPQQWTKLADGVPRDPWNNRYHYRDFPEGDEHGFEIISMGKDGQLGTEDDLSTLDPVQ